MTGWVQNDHEESFARADTEEAARRLAGVLREEDADVVVGYDWHGGYGHPDHVKVHAVTKRAAEIAGTPRYLEGSMNRDAMIRSHQAAMAAGLDVGNGTRARRWTTATRSAASRASCTGPATSASSWRSSARRSRPTRASPTRRGCSQMPMEMFAVAFAWSTTSSPGARRDVAGWFLDG